MKMNKKKLSIAIFLLIVIISFAYFSSLLIMGSINKSVVRVNGQDVGLNEFKIYLKIVKKDLENQVQGSTSESIIKKMWQEPVEGYDPSERARQNALDMAIWVKIVEQKAKQLDIGLPDIEIALLKEKIRLSGTAKQFGLTEEQFLVFSKVVVLREKLLNYYTKDLKIKEKDKTQAFEAKLKKWTSDAKIETNNKLLKSININQL
jgi:hypothetical protein